MFTAIAAPEITYRNLCAAAVAVLPLYLSFWITLLVVCRDDKHRTGFADVEKAIAEYGRKAKEVRWHAIHSLYHTLMGWPAVLPPCSFAWFVGGKRNCVDSDQDPRCARAVLFHAHRCLRAVKCQPVTPWPTFRLFRVHFCLHRCHQCCPWAPRKVSRGLIIRARAHFAVANSRCALFLSWPPSLRRDPLRSRIWREDRSPSPTEAFSDL